MKTAADYLDAIREPMYSILTIFALLFDSPTPQPVTAFTAEKARTEDLGR